jgi:hypothetical protein
MLYMSGKVDSRRMWEQETHMGLPPESDSSSDAFVRHMQEQVHPPHSLAP